MTRHATDTPQGARMVALLKNLRLTPKQRAAGRRNVTSVCRLLHELYWGASDPDEHAMLIGSWGKRTAVRPPGDVDVLFELPRDLLAEYRGSAGESNVPSRILQRLRQRLLTSYPDTAIRGTGPVLVVPFASLKVEVVPAFAYGDRFQICDTLDGGRMRVIDPGAELSQLETSNRNTRTNTRDLIRMLKCWRHCANAPLKPFWIERLAIAFLDKWSSAPVSVDDYPQMLVAFFKYLASRAGGRFSAPGIQETIWIGDAWLPRVERAHAAATTALALDRAGRHRDAGDCWQFLFGTYIPQRVATT